MNKQLSFSFRYCCNLIAGFLLFNGVWFLLALYLRIDALPFPHQVYADWQQALGNNIVTHTIYSVSRVFAGVGISIVLASILGIAMGASSRANRLLGPLLYFSYPIPKLALLPVVMILLGVGESSKITMIVLIIVLQLTIAIRDAMRAVPIENYALLTSLGASKGEKILHVTFPAVLPAILSALRVSMGIALSVLFFTETYGTNFGLGFYITDCWMRLQYLQMYFGLFLLALLGFVFFIILDVAERYFCCWNFTKEKV